MDKVYEKNMQELPTFAQTTIKYFKEHISEELSLNEVAKMVNYSPYHFIRIFKSITGKTPFEYLLDMKIDKAKHLLLYNDISIIEISLLCGFKDRTHFSATFKKKTGLSPTKYRKLMSKNKKA